MSARLRFRPPACAQCGKYDPPMVACFQSVTVALRDGTRAQRTFCSHDCLRLYERAEREAGA